MKDVAGELAHTEHGHHTVHECKEHADGDGRVAMQVDMDDSYYRIIQ